MNLIVVGKQLSTKIGTHYTNKVERYSVHERRTEGEKEERESGGERERGRERERERGGGGMREREGGEGEKEVTTEPSIDDHYCPFSVNIT